MKVLDEVITGLDICKNFSYCTHPQKGECPYLHEDNTCDQDGLYKDALHYLKEYQEHLKWQAYEEHCLAEEKKKIKQAYEQGYAQAKHDDTVSRSWEESYRQSQMPWNHYTEMGG